MKLIITLLGLALVGCGSSGGGVVSKTPPKQPPGTTVTVTQTFTANRTSGGVNTPGTAIAVKTTVVTIPKASDFLVIANAAEPYHVSIDIGTESCDFIHNAGDGFISNGSGCTTINSTVTLSTGQSVTVMVSNNAQTNNTIVEVAIILQY